MNEINEIEKIINEVEKCAVDIYKELGGDWSEKIYQKAMEISLREKGIDYESQRILPISYKGHHVGEGIPDLIIWIKKGRKKIAVLIELKQDREIKEDHRKQVIKYLEALIEQKKWNEEVYSKGFILNFPSTVRWKVAKKEIERVAGVEVLPVGYISPQQYSAISNEGYYKTSSLTEKRPAYNIKEIQQKYPRAYTTWTNKEDIRLKNEYIQGKTINELVDIFQRRPSAIRIRLRRLRLVE